MDKQQVLINIIQNKYAEISEIERKFGIFGIDGDFRPRIEHYHDAIRAIDNDVADGLNRNSRLSAERLAYDVEMLRQITARPTVAGRGEHHLSTQNEVALNQQLAENINPDAADKRKLTALYRDYTVFFIALLLEKIELISEPTSVTNCTWPSSAKSFTILNVDPARTLYSKCDGEFSNITATFGVRLFPGCSV